jgi:hypothetical protein
LRCAIERLPAHNPEADIRGPRRPVFDVVIHSGIGHRSVKLYQADNGLEVGPTPPLLAARRDHTAAIIGFEAPEQWDGSRDEGDQKGSTSEAAVFKLLPLYDPVGIAVLGFGIVFAVALALAF